MFLFSCCQSFQSGNGFQLQKTNKSNQQVSQFYNTIQEIDKQQLRNPNNRLIKLKKSQYDQVRDSYLNSEKKYIDQEFPPNQKSLGKIEGLTFSKWKRISDIIKNPQLFQGKITPKQVIQGSFGDCYFLSALAALAENQNLIKNIFKDQKYNKEGIYKIPMRIDGQIEELLVDDFIPVNQSDQPLFCQPNKNEIWVLILQKAWAKAHGSYANIVSGSPAQVFKAITFAPVQQLLVKQSLDQRQKLWKNLTNYCQSKFPICCGTHDSQQVSWEFIHLSPSHSYTLIDTAYLQDSQGSFHKVVKLRNPWGSDQWEGQANANDKQFWQKIISSHQKTQFLDQSTISNQGIFFMTFFDFCKYFIQIHVCVLYQRANYINEPIFCNKKNGSIFQFTVQNQGVYTLQIHQSPPSSWNQGSVNNSKREDGLCRSTLMVFNLKNNNFTFVQGVLNLAQQDSVLRLQLNKGVYIIFAKLDPTRKQGYIPNKSSVSIYSQYYTQLRQEDRKKYPNILENAFLAHGRLNKRNTYNNDLMWISYKLLYKQGGYAYIAMGNDPSSNKKFIVTFDESQFQKMNFKLKKPYKRHGDGQSIQILPGQQKIILTRVKDTVIVKSMKFPPEIGIKMEPLK